MFIYIMSQAQDCYLQRANEIATSDLHYTPSGRRFANSYWARAKPFMYTLLTTFFCLMSPRVHLHVSATSINYGISQQPITDINQLMPKLCQNQSVICEGSFCIPGVRRCVCDLRMPVKFGRFCLRQVDIDTKCFVTSQCNHTIKDAVCIDSNSNSILDAESSKFKLDQWQQLNELRQMSQSATSKDSTRQSSLALIQSTQKPMFLVEGIINSQTYEARDDVIKSNARNSPYEINYSTSELLIQNHTRRRTNSSMNDLNNRIMGSVNPIDTANSNVLNITRGKQSDDLISGKSALPSSTLVPTTKEPEDVTVRPSDEIARSTRIELTPSTQMIDRSISTTTASNEPLSRRKTVIKTPNWPPGVCSCSFGFMFDPMLRKCLALSLADSHCQSDTDCKQVPKTHCSTETKKCECDEPLIWNQTELSCQRPKPTHVVADSNPSKDAGFVDSVLSPLILDKLLPDQSMLLLIFVVVIIIGTLVILRMTVKCFSSSSSALISPTNKKKRPGQNNNLPPRSPYATLRRPDHKPNSQLSNFTQATRGRILNYDFEQDGTNGDDGTTSPNCSNTKSRTNEATTLTLGRQKKHKNEASEHSNRSATMGRKSKPHKESDEQVDSLMELNDNISVSHLESENKSENSILTIPGPPATQAPPYMLASAMKGQGSAIAAAAAAVANKRMQMAQKRNTEQNTGNPVFL